MRRRAAYISIQSISVRGHQNDARTSPAKKNSSPGLVGCSRMMRSDGSKFDCRVVGHLRVVIMRCKPVVESDKISYSWTELGRQQGGRVMQIMQNDR
jgi:hypothetical protein